MVPELQPSIPNFFYLRCRTLLNDAQYRSAHCFPKLRRGSASLFNVARMRIFHMGCMLVATGFMGFTESLVLSCELINTPLSIPSRVHSRATDSPNYATILTALSAPNCDSTSVLLQNRPVQTCQNLCQVPLIVHFTAKISGTNLRFADSTTCHDRTRTETHLQFASHCCPRARHSLHKNSTILKPAGRSHLGKIL